ncbi:MAG: class I SAM-dependent methyltransferase [Clostridia bacterium]|nr:class I SAM-dependent methyltransferase [Clostridia bacterium]
MNKSYSVIANSYDNLTHNDCDYNSWSQYLFAVAKSHNVKSVVDIACGTGKMTQLLAKHGLQLVGVDSSAEMLDVASQKCRAIFVKQDMKKLALPRPVDMAVCVNDGTNYIAPQDLVSYFLAVHANLKSGAPFVFDISSAHKLQNVVGNNVFYVDDEQKTLLWTNSLGKNTVTMNLTLFTKCGATYTRSDESHTQYIHTQQCVQDCLREAGFHVVEVTADYGKQLTDDALRITFYAIKK